MKLLTIFQNKIVRNSGWLIGGKIAQMVISLFVGMLTARFLGPANYGLINYASSYIAFFTSFCTLGINSLLVKEFVDKPDDEGMVIGTTLILRAISSILSAILIVAIVSVVDRDEPTTILVVSLCSLDVVFTIFNTFDYWFQRHLKAKYTAVAALVAYTVTAVYRIVLLILGKGVVWFAVAASVDHVCVAILLIWFYKKHNGQRMRFSWTYGKELLSRSKYFILSSIMVAVYGQTDKLMLKQMMGLAETGFYSTALTINTMWCFVLGALIDSVRPSILEAYKNGDMTRFNIKNRQLYALVFYVSVGVAVMFNFFAELVIWMLYGNAYMRSAMPLRIISWYTAFSYLGAARSAWIVSKNMQRHIVTISVVAAITNVILNFVLIPIWGASGAALASLVAQMLTGFVLPFFIKDLRPNAVLMLEGIMLRDVFNKQRKST